MNAAVTSKPLSKSRSGAAQSTDSAQELGHDSAVPLNASTRHKQLVEQLEALEREKSRILRDIEAPAADGSIEASPTASVLPQGVLISAAGPLDQ